MSLKYFTVIILSFLTFNSCMMNVKKPVAGVRIETTGTDPNTGVQLSKQQTIKFVIDSRGHSPNISNQYLSDEEYTATMHGVLNDCFFAKKKRTIVEEIDSKTTPFRSLIDMNSEDPCLLYISYANFEGKQYSAGGGNWMNGVYTPGGTNSYIRTIFTIQVIFYGKFYDQYMVYNEVPAPASGSHDELIKSVSYNSRTILDEFYKHIFGY
jgi:hypothetical protein